MPFVQASFWSQALEKQCQMNVILPSVGAPPYPVYYLLHGLSDDYTIWHRRTSIERYVAELPLIVVMPDGFRGFYTDNEEGPAYERYMVEDVMGFVETFFPVAKSRAKRCIGGLSMGGYGSMRLGLVYAERFASINSHSGAFKYGREFPAHRDTPEFHRIFGRTPKNSKHDLFKLVEKLKRAGTRLPKIQIDCGTEDHLLQDNREFHALLEKLKIPHDYTEYSGAHTWDYWDLHVRKALAFHSRVLGIGKPKVN